MSTPTVKKCHYNSSRYQFLHFNKLLETNRLRDWRNTVQNSARVWLLWSLFIHKTLNGSLHCTVTSLPGDTDLSIKIERHPSLERLGWISMAQVKTEYHPGFSLQSHGRTQDSACSLRNFYFRTWTLNAHQLCKLSNLGNSEAVEQASPNDFCLLKPLKKSLCIHKHSSELNTAGSLCLPPHHHKKPAATAIKVNKNWFNLEQNDSASTTEELLDTVSLGVYKPVLTTYAAFLLWSLLLNIWWQHTF